MTRLRIRERTRQKVSMINRFIHSVHFSWRAFVSFTKICFFLFILLIIFARLFLLLVNPADYKKEINAYVFSQTGLNLKIKGNIKWNLLSPKPDLILENIELGDDETIISAKKVSVEISLAPLFFNRFEVAKLEIINCNINLNKDNINDIKAIRSKMKAENNPVNDAVINSKVGGADSTLVNYKEIMNLPSVKQKQMSFAINNVYFQNMTVNVNNEQKILIKELDLNNKHVGSSFKTTVLYDRDFVKLHFTTVEVSRLIKDLLDGNDLIFNGGIDGSKLQVKFLFKVKDAFNNLKVIGNTNISSQDIKYTLANFVDLPKIDKFDLKTDFIFAQNSGVKNAPYLAFNNFNFVSGKSNINGKINMILADRPMVQADLSSKYFDLEQFLEFPKAGSVAAKEAAVKKAKVKKKDRKHKNVFKNTPFLNEVFMAFDASAKIKIDYFKIIDGLFIKNISAELVLKDGKGVAMPIKGNIGGGNVSAVVNANISKSLLWANVSVDASNVEIGKFFEYFNHPEFLQGGKADFTGYFKSSGNNLEQLMKNMNGSLKTRTNTRMLMDAEKSKFFFNDLVTSTLNAGKDVLTGFAGIFVGKDKNAPKSVLKVYCVAANLDINKGVSYSDRGVAVETSDYNLVLDGNVNLGAETMELNLVPVKKEIYDLSLSLKPTQLVYITGSLAQPQISFDALGATKEVGETALIGLALVPFTAGASLLLTGGATLLAKNLFNSIGRDAEPCKHAYMGKYKSRDDAVSDAQLHWRQNDLIKKAAVKKAASDKKFNAVIDGAKLFLKTPYVAPAAPVSPVVRNVAPVKKPVVAKPKTPSTNVKIVKTLSKTPAVKPVVKPSVKSNAVAGDFVKPAAKPVAPTVK